MKGVVPYSNPSQVKDVVRRFESCDYSAGDFHHQQHITVAMCYLMEVSEQDALDRLRSGLKQFLQYHQRTGAYHETVTVYWIKRVRDFLECSDITRSLEELANELTEECSDPRQINAHFSEKLLSSDEARQGWVEPDLLPLK